MNVRRTLSRLALVAVALVMIAPFYLLVVNAVKPQQAILEAPFALPGERFTLEFLRLALSSPDFDIVHGYAVSAFFVIAVNICSIVLAGPLAYVIARGQRARHHLLLVLFIAGTFIPSQVLVIPVVYVLKVLGLMGTMRGFIAFETTLTLPFSLFLYTAYIRTIPRALDESAAIDGAGRIRTFWQVIFPLMRPVVATMVILNTLSVWNDFVNPQIILGPGSGIYTVTTGIYAAVGQYTTDYTIVFPTLLLALVPILVFFVIMQRHIVSGLTAGATKG